MILASAEAVEKYNLKPIAKVVGYGDAAHEPEWFTTAPSKAVPVALKKANLSIADIDYWELNQAFAVVGLANIKELGLDASKVDVNGGAVSLGHPLGNSGSRIIVTLINVLKQNNGRYGGYRQQPPKQSCAAYRAADEASVRRFNERATPESLNQHGDGQ